MTELPPAVAKYIADAEPFVRGTDKAVGAVKKFDASAEKATLAARRMGLAAKEAGERAAVAGKIAAEAAEKATKGMLKEEAAAALAAKAVRELERAEIAQAAAAIASAESSEKASRAYRSQAVSGAAATKSAALMRGELVTLVATGAAIAPAFITAGVGVASFGALAVPTVKKVIEAQTKMADTWDSLSDRQKVSAAGTHLLIDQYKGLAKAVEPDVLKVYNGALATAASTMPKLVPITKATSRALLDFESRMDSALNSDRARQFVGFVEREAGPAIDALGDAFGGGAHLAASLTESLAPLATTGLSLVGMTANLVAGLSDLSPELAQLAVLSVGLRGPLSSAGEMVGKAGEKYKTYTAGAKGASLATKGLNLITAAGPNLYMAAGLAIGYFALKALNAQKSTDKLVASITVANRAIGNNIGGYQAANRALAAQLVPSTRRAEAAQKALGDGVNATTVQMYQGADAARSLTEEWVNQARSDNDKKIRNIQAGAAALSKQYGVTTDQAIALADAVGVDMSRRITENGTVVAATAAKFDRYRQAVEMAKNPTAVVAQAWKDASNEALSLKDRVNALQTAMDAYLNPALNVLSATNQMRDALAATDNVLKNSKSTAAEKSRQLESDLGSIGRWVSAQGAAGKAVQLTDAAITKHLPKLMALAGNSRVGKAGVDGLALSLQGTITRTKDAIIVTDRLGNRVKVLPSGKVIKLSAATGQANAAFGSILSKLEAMRGGVTVPVRYVQYGPGPSRVGGSGMLGRQAYMPHADGGLITGPGTGTSDSILARLSNKEYVVNARSTAKHLPLLEAINAERYADGGMVGAPRFASGGQVRVGGVSVSASQWRSLGVTLGKDFAKAMTGSTAEIGAMDRRLERTIARLFGGKKTTLDNKLIAYLDRNSNKMQDLSERRALAKEGLKEGKQYAATLTGNARSYAGLSGLDAPTSGAQIRQGLTMRLSSLTRYASVIKALAKRGLSKSLLRQVLDMGPEEGLKYGEMLLGASKGVFEDINAAQKQIDRTSASFGRSGADALYDAGKNAGRGFLTGLNAELKHLDKTMDRLALRMSRSLKKALRIKSPSQLPAIRNAGAMTVAGVAAGMNSNLGVIDLASERMTRRLAQPRTRPFIAPIVAHRGASATPGQASQPQVIQLKVYLDGREIRAAVQSQTLRYNRRNVSNGLSLTGS